MMQKKKKRCERVFMKGLTDDTKVRLIIALLRWISEKAHRQRTKKRLLVTEAGIAPHQIEGLYCCNSVRPKGGFRI